jgi:hypothetical protein
MSGSRPKAVVMNVRERTRGWLNAINLHWAGVAVLALVCLYLIVQMGLAWKLANSQDAEALAQQRVQLKLAQYAAKPLQGLDVKLTEASKQADKFYMERLPVSYSEIASELGALRTASNVRLSRVGYSQPVAGGAAGTDKTMALIGPDQFGGKLTEVQMDASLTGDYRGLIQFINGLERDKVFFLINGVTLTGQQSGQVSLRLRLTTYLRGIVPADEAAKANAAETGSALDDLDKAAAAQSAKQGGKR